jgi:hypothetical protein
MSYKHMSNRHNLGAGEGAETNAPFNIFSTQDIFWDSELKKDKLKKWGESGGKGGYAY